jgi:hypothetical protein
MLAMSSGVMFDFFAVLAVSDAVPQIDDADVGAMCLSPAEGELTGVGGGDPEAGIWRSHYAGCSATA